MLKALADCHFYITVTDSGQFVGRVHEYPDLRTRPQKTSLDASDAIVTATRDKIAHLDAAIAGLKAAPRNA